MVKTDSPNYLVYIEPSSSKKSPLPCLGGWIELMKLALNIAKHWTALENSNYELTFNKDYSCFIGVKTLSTTDKKLHSSSELIILDTSSYMDGGSLTLKCNDRFGKRYDIAFHQNVNLLSREKLAGRMYLDDILIEERSEDEKNILRD